MIKASFKINLDDIPPEFAINPPSPEEIAKVFGLSPKELPVSEEERLENEANYRCRCAFRPFEFKRNKTGQIVAYGRLLPSWRAED
jgi:hypothetical protein